MYLKVSQRFDQKTLFHFNIFKIEHLHSCIIGFCNNVVYVCISQKMKFKICNGFTGYNGYCVGVLMETVMVSIGLNW